MKCTWWREGPVVLILLLQAAVAVTVVYQRPSEIALDVGESTDLAYIEGFHDAEYSGFYSFSFRWTQGQARIRFPGIGRDRPLRLTPDAVGRLGQDGQPITLTLAADGQVLGSIRVGPIPAGRMAPYRYTVAVPANPSFSGDLVVQLESPTASSESDRRQLGLLVDRVDIFCSQGLGLPPLLPSLLLLAVTLLAYAAVRLAGWPAVAALVLAILLSWLLSALLTSARLRVAPYLPAFAAVAGVTTLLLPLARVPFVPALQTWRAINLFVLAASASLMARTYRFGRNLWLWAGLGLVLLNWRPVGDTIAYGQVDVLLLFLIVGTLAALRGDRDDLAGFLLALATMLKLYPAFLALFLLARREWRALGAFVVSLVLLAGLSAAILGWPVHATYLLQVLPKSGGGTAWVENQTFNGFFNRLFTDHVALIPETSRRADGAAYLAGAVLTLVTLWLIIRFARRGGLGYDLGFCLLMVTMLLALPAAWIHYETILVLPFVLIFVYGREQDSLPFRVIVLMGLAFGLLCFGNAWSVFQREVYGRFWQLLLSYKVYGMLLLWLALGLLLWLGPAATVQTPLFSMSALCRAPDAPNNDR